MAASSSKLRLHQGPVDVWSIREKLALACSVMKSGDQNWVSVSRAIKPFLEADRPSNWFSQRNCALQYSDLLEKVETPKRKRGDGGETDTPADQIFRKLMTERIEELRKIALDEQQRYKKLKRDVECIKSGQFDERLTEVWDRMQAEKAAEEAAKEAEKKAIEDARTQSTPSKRDPVTKRPSLTSQSSLSEQDDTQESYPEFPLLEIPQLGEDDNSSLSLTPQSLAVTQPDQRSKPVTPTSPLLSSLLQSKHKSANSLQQLKNEAEQEAQVQQIALQLQHSAESAMLQQKQQKAETTTSHTHQPPDPNMVRDINMVLKELTAASQIEDSTNLTTDTPQAPPTSQKMPTAHPESLPTSPSCAAPTLSKLLFTPAQPKLPSDTQVSAVPVATTPIITVTKATAPQESCDTPEIKSSAEANDQDSADESVNVDVTAVEVSSTEGDGTEVTEDPSSQSGGKDQRDDDCTADDTTQSETSTPRVDNPAVGQEDEDSSEVAGCSFLSVDEEVSIKDEPPSPASSVSSKVSESGGKNYKPRGSRGRGRPSGRRGRSARRSVQEEDKKDDASSKHSDVDLSDYDDQRESDDLAPAGSLFSESIPNSPASLSMCSDTEDEKAFKTWKKSIMLVWRSAANHKYANVFLHPVTNEIAPGYKGIVHRPMDLGTIKKNIESGGLRTTSEFQRDMMLMFTNAIMYNNTNQPVFKMATEMYNDVMQHIEQYVNTQLMVQSNETKVLRQSRRGELQEKEEEGKKRRTSQEQPAEGGKTKRRKTRADDT